MMWAWGAFFNWPSVVLMPVASTIGLSMYFFLRTFGNDRAVARTAKSIGGACLLAALLNVVINGMLVGPMEIIIAGWLGLFAAVFSLILMAFHLLIFDRKRHG